MLNMTIADIKEAAAGTITGTKTPTTWDDKKHPVNQWINADVDQREKIVNNTGVCGMFFYLQQPLQNHPGRRHVVGNRRQRQAR
eukprot:scaffold16172_cov42-Attheya_sp.AAC.2